MLVLVNIGIIMFLFLSFFFQSALTFFIICSVARLLEITQI